jgi:hypothetical protein
LPGDALEDALLQASPLCRTGIQPFLDRNIYLLNSLLLIPNLVLGIPPHMATRHFTQHPPVIGFPRDGMKPTLDLFDASEDQDEKIQTQTQTIEDQKKAIEEGRKLIISKSGPN